MAEILVIGQALVRQLLPMERCIELMEAAFRAASDGSAVQGLRVISQVPEGQGGVLGVMPGGLAQPPVFGAKIISVRHGGAAQSHQGGVLLFDTGDFSPVALLHAGDITAIRTAAATAVATRLLARPDATRLAVLGTGEQAETHIQAMTLIRDWQEIVIWGRSIEKAHALAARVGAPAGSVVRVAETVSAAVRGADVVCMVTAAQEPIFTADMIEPGVHLNLVGSSVATQREVDSGVVARAAMFVDHEAMTRSAGGEFIMALHEGAIEADHIRGEIGAVLLGRLPGRTHESEITMFKSLGMPAEDFVAANFIVQQARHQGVGVLAAF